MVRVGAQTRTARQNYRVSTPAPGLRCGYVRNVQVAYADGPARPFKRRTDGGVMPSGLGPIVREQRQLPGIRV